MVKAEFKKENSRLIGFKISGHAGYGDKGEDVVCAGVSSAVQLTANAITHFFDIEARIDLQENLIVLDLPSRFQNIEVGMRLIESLKSHLELLAEEFPGTVEII
jgi:uncharacterized protein YsxB (DUF464 family)